MAMTGGCQCGAVRFICEPDASSAHVCHCRMCQKAVGNLFASLVKVNADTLTWTRNAPKCFRSSSIATRSFCADCGTPLQYEAPDGAFLTIGAFDHPEDLPPLRQYGVEGRYEFTDGLQHLPGTRTSEDALDQTFLGDLVSYQHPDEPGPDERPSPR